MKPSIYIGGVIPRAEFIESLLQFEGVDYSPSVTAVWHENEKWGGVMSCYGLLLMALREKKLLAPDFDVNLSPGTFGQSEAKTLAEMLRLNCNEIPRRAMLPGDVVTLRYLDVDPLAREPHHVGAIVPMPDGSPGFLHASGVAGRVVRFRCDALFDLRLDRVLRLNALKD